MSCRSDLCLFGIVNQYLTSVVQFTFMPVGPVVKVYFSGCRILGEGGSGSLVMRTSLIPSGPRDLSLRMCHFF